MMTTVEPSRREIASTTHFHCLLFAVSINSQLYISIALGSSSILLPTDIVGVIIALQSIRVGLRAGQTQVPNYIIIHVYQRYESELNCGSIAFPWKIIVHS